MLICASYVQGSPKFSYLKFYIPKILLYSRLIFCLIIVTLIVFEYPNSKWIVLVLLYVGVLADVFDGIIARRLNISTESFRLLDTLFDLLFYLAVFLFIFSTNSHEIESNVSLILGALSLEFLMYAISLFRFNKLPSPHAILSKFWGLYLVVEFTLLILEIKGNHFAIALAIGLFVHLDRVLIYILLRKWDHDIPSSYHALLIRNGKQIKRRRLFNG